MSFVTGAQKYDVVSLGDVVTDEFIRLPEGPVKVRSDEQGRWLEIPLGTKLIVEDDAPLVTGGSAANAAVAMSRLGLRVGLASYLAHDQTGLDILSAMHAEDVDTGLIHVDSPSHTVRNFVLSYRGERTILVRHAGFNYHWAGFRDHDMPKWLYINSLGPEALEYQDAIADWLDEHPSVRLAFQPGTFQLEAGIKRIARLYQRAEVLLCSRAGAETIAEMKGADPARLLGALLALGSTAVVVFDENGGAIAAEKSDRYEIGPFPSEQPLLDRTGSGDAFAATVVAALVRSVPLREALRWPPVNVVAVSRQFGAQHGLLRLEELINQLDVTPSRFAVREL